MKYIWVIKVTYLVDIGKTVNFNEGYSDYTKARNAVLKKIKPDNINRVTDYKFIDTESNIEYELKLVDIIE